jgi:hypothetical protein
MTTLEGALVCTLTKAGRAGLFSDGLAKKASSGS